MFLHGGWDGVEAHCYTHALASPDRASYRRTRSAFAEVVRAEALVFDVVVQDAPDRDGQLVHARDQGALWTSHIRGGPPRM